MIALSIVLISLKLPAVTTSVINATITKAPVTTIASTNVSSLNQTKLQMPSTRQLAQAAPYALESSVKSGTRNIMFRLNPNRDNAGTLNSVSGGIDNDPWAIVGQNGTLVGTRVNFNLKKLLETLNNNNFTSEVKFDDSDGLFNITITNYSPSEGAKRENISSLDESLLEELLLDAKWQNLNGSSVLKDNHKYESSNGLRSKPKQIIEAVITPPPIRSAIEVVAENYTSKKIAEEANIFAIKLLHQLNIEKLGSRNLIQFPFSVYQGMALLLSSAMGDTSKELDKVLLGSQSPYENTKLTHDQDRTRLLASLGDVIRQLHYRATHHFQGPINETPSYLNGGTQGQHLIIANNLLFSPSAYEISNEFKNSINNYYNNTAVTKIETGSTESIQVVNSWIRRATNGVIPSVLSKKNTFDEYNVMSLLCTSWLAQEWKDTFYRVTSPLRSNIRLKTQGRSRDSFSSYVVRDENNSLLEFVDDNKRSHFVDYIKSKPTKNIHHYHSVLNGLVVDIVSVPFSDSNHRLLALTPINGNTINSTQLLSESLLSQSSNSNNNQASQFESQQNNLSYIEPPDSSLLSKLIATFSNSPRKTLKSFWNIISPDLITKKTMQNIQLARQKNFTIDTIEASVIPLVQLSIPILRAEADSSLNAALNHIGIVNSFDPDQANFIGINGHPFNYYKLHLSNVVSKTTFNLNERGINYDKTIRTLEALRIFHNSKPKQQESVQAGKDLILEGADDDYIKLDIIDEVKLNKPFMYLICDIKTKLILYTGVVRNPTQEGP